MQQGLVDIYQSENEAERSTQMKDYVSAIQHHTNAITKINMLMTKMLQRKQSDEFGSMDALNVLKNQITARIDQLQSIIDINVVNTSKQRNENHDINLLGNTSLQLFRSTIAEIETSLFKNLRIRMSDVPTSTHHYNAPIINKEEIKTLEHYLQILNFKDSKDLKERNDCLSKLNSLYYSELITYQNTIKDVVSIVKDVETGMKNNNDWKPIDTITDETAVHMIGELKQKISSLERDKLHMENEIVLLKERWNSAVHSNRMHQLNPNITNAGHLPRNIHATEGRTSGVVNIQSDYEDDDDDDEEEE